jgi:hypothetical protein
MARQAGREAEQQCRVREANEEIRLMQPAAAAEQRLVLR